MGCNCGGSQPQTPGPATQAGGPRQTTVTYEPTGEMDETYNPARPVMRAVTKVNG